MNPTQKQFSLKRAASRKQFPISRKQFPISKRGFLFPFEQWLGTEWRETFTALDQRSPVPLQTWYRQWAVLVMAAWRRRLGDCDHATLPHPFTDTRVNE